MFNAPSLSSYEYTPRVASSRVKCFFEIALGMIQSRSVQMQRIAAHLKDHTSFEGRAQKVYRFFAAHEINCHDIAQLILKKAVSL